jgi:arabinose-5-phosphate isomerase
MEASIMTDTLADVIRIGKQAIAIEAAAVAALEDRIGEPFRSAVRLILDMSGRLVLTGMGKSGEVARKLSATFSSTGTASFYLHPAEAVHGDLGAVTPEDVILCLSYGGETDELSAILPGFKRLRAPIIAMVSSPCSTLGRAADLILDISVDREACPLGLAPTASTTAMLAMGDALAMATMSARKFTREQFALCHPAGSLGRKLLTIDEVMRQGADNPTIGPDAPVKEALWGMTRTRLGAAMVVDADGHLLGIIADGDIRRMMDEVGDIRHYQVADVMTRNPRVICSGRLAVEAVAIMQNPPRLLNVLPVVDTEGRCIGSTHIQDLVQIGIV